jgi:hypothetical protein
VAASMAAASMAAASGVVGTARPRHPAETGRAGFPRPFLFVPVTRPGSITRDNPVPITDLFIGLEDRLLPCAGVEISIPAVVCIALVKPWLEAS